jgi:hypothetical protein
VWSAPLQIEQTRSIQHRVRHPGIPIIPWLPQGSLHMFHVNEAQIIADPSIRVDTIAEQVGNTEHVIRMFLLALIAIGTMPQHT